MTPVDPATVHKAPGYSPYAGRQPGKPDQNAYIER